MAIWITIGINVIVKFQHMIQVILIHFTNIWTITLKAR